MRAAAVIVGVFVLIASGSALAQDASRTAVSQMNVTAPGQAAATGATQIGPRSAARVDVAPLLPSDRQVTGSIASATDPVAYLQLNCETATIDAGPQVTI